MKNSSQSIIPFLRKGALSDTLIHQCFDEKIITTTSDSKKIGPSSLDLSVDLSTLVQVPAVFLPSKKIEPITETLKTLGAQKVDLPYLKKGKVYVAKIKESVYFPRNIFARANPKSSTGRSDIHVNLIADFVPRYDFVPQGYSGDLYVVIRSHSFDIDFSGIEEVSLNQLRFFYNTSGIVGHHELQELVIEKKIISNEHKKRSIMFSDNNIYENKLLLSLDLRDWGNENILGYVAKKNVSEPLIWKTGVNNALDFFEPIEKVSDDRAITLKEKSFYILSSRESVYIPKEYACEMVSFDDSLGELRAHYAGFIDNGWGEKKPRPLTLEVRAYEPTMVYHGQPIASLVLNKTMGNVERGYDEIPSSNYTNQKTAMLGKFFK
jgi:dCTP deaminase